MQGTLAGLKVLVMMLRKMANIRERIFFKHSQIWMLKKKPDQFLASESVRLLSERRDSDPRHPPWQGGCDILSHSPYFSLNLYHLRIFI